MKDQRKKYCLLVEDKGYAYELINLRPQDKTLSLEEAEKLIQDKGLKLVKVSPAGFKVYA